MLNRNERALRSARGVAQSLCSFSFSLFLDNERTSIARAATKLWGRALRTGRLSAGRGADDENRCLTQAQSDKASSGTSAGATAPGSAMFKDLDKNNDGSISRDEAKGTPYETDFSRLDKDGHGKLSPSEHAAAPAAGEKAGAGATKPEAPAPKKQ
jgi:hypothetical protein